MKTNPRNYRRDGLQFAYVLDIIDVEDYGMTATTDSEKVRAFFEIYNEEYDNQHNRRLYPNECQRLANYIQGLPSCISIAFTNYDISEQLKAWGLKGTPANVDAWFERIAARLLKLREIYC